MVIALFNILAASTAATVYGLWAYKWATRRVWVLAGLYWLVSAACMAFSAVSAILWLKAVPISLTVLLSPNPLLLLVLLIPAAARAIELGREERETARARALRAQLCQEGG